MNRRDAISILAGAAISPLAACRRSAASPEVILYSSVDDHILRGIVDVYREQSETAVQVVGDTEATKTTGLVQRLLDEKSRPRADVWWSSEPVGTVRLAREGVLAPFSPASARDFGGAWPAGMRGASGLWHGFGCRARVTAHTTKSLRQSGLPPTTLGELTAPEWKGRIGMADPRFGTTRTHMAALAAADKDSFRAWLEAMRTNGVRIYPSNSAVVRAIADGEIDAGATDTDDVLAAIREKWSIGMGYGAGPGLGLFGGTLVIPNTAALVKGGPNPAEAGPLLEFILSAKVERLLAAGESKNIPIRPDVAREFADLPAVTVGAAPDWDTVADHVGAAMSVCREVLPELD